MNRNWNKVRIEEICRIRRGASPRPIHEYISETGIPWVKIADATASNSRYINETREFIKVKGKEKSRFIKKGTLILSNSATPGIPKIMGIDGCVHDGWLIIDEIRDCDKNFLYYLFLNEREKLINLSGGSVFRNLKTDIVKGYKVKIPPLNEQKAIAHTLSTLDKKIETNNQINKNLEEIARTIFRHWFIDFEFPDENGQPYKTSGGKMVESDLGIIPEGWGGGKLNDLIKITSGRRPVSKLNFSDKNFKFPLIGASSIIGYTDEYNFDEEILVIGRVGTHGVVQRFNDKVWASDNTLVIKSLIYEYVYQILNLIDYTSLNRGSTQPLITQTDIKNYNVLIPGSEILSKYERFAYNIFGLHLNITNENQKLMELRDILLPKLMTGEIKIPLMF